MSDVVISVQGLGKKYRVRHQAERPRYTALRDVIAEKARGFFQKAKFGKPKAAMADQNRNEESRKQKGPESAEFPLSQFPISALPSSEDFWALKDVSFEVRQGEVVGIIGRNGAGKSTLLKILSRITEPTTGRVEITGRVGSLLEVGTGFHPELTGRENIFLNGAILGMHRAEIKQKFDEIVAFAEVEKFLDTPVKRYSSGMYVRLAFAVAAHLEPEILIVDEVLAVGDAEFQKKCLGKMGEVAKGGRTVLFVSHNMAAVQSLCSRGILLCQGMVEINGTAQSAVRRYLARQDSSASFARPLEPGARVRVIGGQISADSEDNQLRMRLQVRVWSDANRKVSFDLRLAESAGNPVGFGSLGTLCGDELVSLRKGENQVRFFFPADQLANGSYEVSLDVTFPFREYLDRAERCLSFDLERPAAQGRTHVTTQRWGYGSFEIPLHFERELASGGICS